MTGDSLTPEQPPSGPLYARQSDETPTVGTQRGAGGTSGPQTGTEGFGTLPDFLEVARYRHDHGHQAWAWRCWGNGDCDGRLSLDHSSQGAADRSARKHLAESHADVLAALNPQEQP